ncbi:MAG: hypothetical protein sL5_03950 [Candidatus Mesenet longicola]|uniref:Uncharacterized protein n=1 Tax=Candidatus Mesenet longicola TaxID=1892558 RepID=A0A8J3MMQ3_9RICK|nr:MAG: hypothetical protein sGL2_05710 [Candidatus Mesenet longicola]GHM59402.1 MAG: hypothetical protein sL5_03950 [Candidatus Mesenet longicola]
MNNYCLKKALKKNKANLIVNSLLITSAVLIGIGLFDRNIGKTGFTFSAIAFTTLSTLLMFAIAATLYCAKKNCRDEEKVVFPSVILSIVLLAGIILVGIGLFDTGNKLGNVGFITGNVGFALIAFSVLWSVYSMMKNIKSRYEHKYEKLLPHVKCLLCDLDNSLRFYNQYEGCIKGEDKYIIFVSSEYYELQKYPDFKKQVDDLFIQHGLQNLYFKTQRRNSNYKHDIELCVSLKEALKSYKVWENLLINTNPKRLVLKSDWSIFKMSLESVFNKYSTLQEYPKFQELVAYLFTQYGLQDLYHEIQRQESIGSDLRGVSCQNFNEVEAYNKLYVSS